MSHRKRPSRFLGIDMNGSSNKRAKSPTGVNVSTSNPPTQPTQTTSQNGPSSSHKAKGAAEAMLSKFKNSMKLLRQYCGVFDPLATAAEELYKVLEAMETISLDEGNLQDVRTDLTEWVMVLSAYLEGERPSQMSDRIKKLISVLNQEASSLMGLTARGSTRVDECNQKSRELERSYRRVEEAFRQLQTDASLSTWMNTDKQLKDSLLKEMSPAHGARYDSAYADKIERRSCLENTRVLVLGEIRDWVRSIDMTKIYWMNGMAGTGKTTIACSISNELERDRRLGASFFCSRGSSDCRDVNRILPTIAYQLAQVSYPFRNALCRTLSQEANIGQRKVSVQFEYLIRSPLLEVADVLPKGLVIVIDALDECSDPGATKTIVDALFRNVLALPVRFFLTSRPEPAISDFIMSQGDISRTILHLHNIEEQIVKEDIKTYLAVELAGVNPSEQKINQLAEQSGILFIYAATVTRFVLAQDLGADPTERLAAVLVPSTTRDPQEYHDIDELYRTILDGVFDNTRRTKNEIELIQRVLWTVVCAGEPLAEQILAALVGATRNQVRAALKPLKSVLHISDNGGVVTALHASFTDFLIDETRSTERLHCNVIIQNQTLATRCFAIMEEQLRFNICGLESSYVFDADVPNISTRVNMAISPELFYACRFWARHLTQATFRGSLDHLDGFLRHRLLFWMEVLNLTERMGDGPSMLVEIKEWLLGNPGDHELLDDALNFVATFVANDIHQCTPHIYVSLLPASPKRNKIRQIYLERAQGLVQIDGTTAETQPGPLKLAEWKAGMLVSGIVFLPRATQVMYITALALPREPGFSAPAKVNVWDIAASKLFSSVSIPCTTFIDALNRQTAVALSPGGNKIAYSFNESLYILDAQTGTLLLGPISGHTSDIRLLVFAPGDTHFVSTSEDRTLLLWDPHSDLHPRHLLNRYHSDISSVGFSPCGTFIAAGTGDGVILTWYLTDGTACVAPSKQHSERISSIVFSLDGTRIASASYGRIIVQDSYNGNIIAGPFEVESYEVLAFTSPNAACLACISVEFQTHVILLDVISGSIDTTLRNDRRADTWAMSPDGSTLAISYGGSISLHYVSSKPIPSPDSPVVIAPTRRIESIVCSPSGDKIAATSLGGMIYIWDPCTGSAITHLSAGKARNLELEAVFSSDGLWLVTVSSHPSLQIEVWNVQTGSLVFRPIVDRSSLGPTILGTCFSPDGIHLGIITGHDDRPELRRNTLAVVNMYTGKALSKLFLPQDTAAVAFSPDGNHVLTSSLCNGIQVWGSYTGTLDEPRLMEASNADNRRLLSSESWRWYNRESSEYSRTDDRGLTALSPKNDRVECGYYQRAIFNPLATSELVLRDSSTRELLASPFGRRGESITTFSFSRDGTRIFSGSESTREDAFGKKASHYIRAWDVSQVYAYENNFMGLAWEIDVNGWVRNQDAQPIIWIPTKWRRLFPLPPNTLAIGPEGNLKVSMNNLLLGESWVRCYDPNAPTSSL